MRSASVQAQKMPTSARAGSSFGTCSAGPRPMDSSERSGSRGASPFLRLEPGSLVEVLGFLDCADLGRLSQTCSALRFAPSHWALWQRLVLSRFPHAKPPEDGHWKREFHWQCVIAARQEAYQRDMTLGSLGRRLAPPTPLAEPRVDVYSLGDSGTSAALDERMALWRQEQRACAAAREEAAAAAAAAQEAARTALLREVGGAGLASSHSSRGAGDHNELSGSHTGQLRLRQGSAPWSALS